MIHIHAPTPLNPRRRAPHQQRAGISAIIVGVLCLHAGLATAQDSPEQPVQSETHSLNVTFFAQGLSTLEATQGSPAELTLFSFRRLRPGLRLVLWEQRVALDVVWNLAPGSAQLIEARAAMRVRPELVVTVGQFKTPWSRYRLSSGADQVFVDWSRTTKFFGGERQRGASISRPTHNTSGLYYSVGVFEGANARRSHGVGLPLIYDQPQVNPSSLTSQPPDTRVHPELVGHIGWGSPGMNASRLDDTRRGPLSVYTGLGVAHDFDPVTMVDARARASLEFMLKRRGLALYTGAYVIWPESLRGGADAVGMYGGLAELTWRVGERTSIGGRYSRILVSSQLERDARRVRALQGDMTPGVISMDEYGLGARVDLIQERVQLASDVQLHRDHTRDASTSSWLGRVQIQVRY